MRRGEYLTWKHLFKADAAWAGGEHQAVSDDCDRLQQADPDSELAANMSHAVESSRVLMANMNALVELVDDVILAFDNYESDLALARALNAKLEQDNA